MFEEYPSVVTVPELCKMLRIGYNKAYELLGTGQIRHVRVGHRYLIPKDYLIAYLHIRSSSESCTQDPVDL